MNGSWPRHFGPAVILGLGLGLAGCTQTPEDVPHTAPPVVMVSVPVEREVTDYADFTGRTEAVESVEVRARVWGYLDKINFKEGSIVKKGDVLFEIDPQPYLATRAQAEGALAENKARLAQAEAEFDRIKALSKGAAASQRELDKAVADRAAAAASIQAATAALERAKLDVEYTKVVAPITGRVGQYLISAGNLVQSGGEGGGTLLTTIVSVDPMHVYFDVDEPTVLRVRQMIREGKAKSANQPGVDLPVFLGLANEDGHPHRGTVDFVDNQVNPQTGTLRVRGVFPNPDGVLTPGLFGRIRLPIGGPHKALLVSDRAIDSDQGRKILYVLDEKNEVAVRPVQVGARHGGLRVIEEGLRAGERVVVVGLQQVRPGAVVEPKVVDMAAVGRGSGDATPAPLAPNS